MYVYKIHLLNLCININYIPYNYLIYIYLNKFSLLLKLINIQMIKLHRYTYEYNIYING